MRAKRADHVRRARKAYATSALGQYYPNGFPVWAQSHNRPPILGLVTPLPAYGTWACYRAPVKRPAPSLIKILTVPEFMLETAKSMFPSRLKSSATTAVGPSPTPMLVAEAN